MTRLIDSPEHALSDPDPLTAEVLFEEVRRQRRRRRLRNLGVVLVAGLLVTGGVVVGRGGPTSNRPAGLGHPQPAAPAAAGSRSASAQRVKVFDTLASFRGSRSLVVTDADGEGSIQIVQKRGTKEFAVGPPLITTEWNSGTGYYLAHGPGAVWLYEAGSSLPAGTAEVWRFSNSSGAILQKTTVPALRPTLAADASGLYVAVSGAGPGGIPRLGLIFHVRVGARVATTVLSARGVPQDSMFVDAMTVIPGGINADVCTRNGPRGISCHIEEFSE